MTIINRKFLGFTLVELVITIIIMGIVALGISSFISLGANGYMKAVDRERLQSKARFAVMRMKREIQNAVPNSIATDELLVNGKTGKCVSFTPIYAAGTYFNTEDVSNAINGYVVSNIDVTIEKPSSGQTDLIIVNPLNYKGLLGAGSVSRSYGSYGGATPTLFAAGGTAAKLIKMKDYNGALYGAGAGLPLTSPAHRFYIAQSKACYAGGCASPYSVTRMAFCLDNQDRLIRIPEIIGTQVSGTTIARGLDFANSEFRADVVGMITDPSDATQLIPDPNASNMAVSNLVQYQLAFKDQNLSEASIYMDTIQVLNRP